MSECPTDRRNAYGHHRYPEDMSTAAADEKSSSRNWTVAFVVTVVLLNVVEWLTDWSRWVFFVPAAIISVAIVIYYRVNQRRRTQVRDGVQARD